MRVTKLIIAISLLCLLLLAGCGQKLGLEGSLALTAATKDNGMADSVNVEVTATYTNSNRTDLIGVPIDFTISSAKTGAISLPTAYTNSSGSVSVLFTDVPRLPTGNYQLVVTATTGDLHQIQTVVISKQPTTLRIFPPAAALFTNASSVFTHTFNLAKTNFISTFVGLAPISLPIDITATLTPVDPNDTFVVKGTSAQPWTLTTSAAGFANLSSSYTMTQFARGSKIVTINWTATDNSDPLNPVVITGATTQLTLIR